MKLRYVVIALVIVVIVICLAMFFTKRSSEFPFDPRLRELLKNVEESIVVTTVFSEGSSIPRRYTCDGQDVSPPLTISNIPKNARALVIIMLDPDAPKGVFYHWILIDVPSNISHIPENIPKKPVVDIGTQLKNDFGYNGYGGPCPPPGTKHRYFIIVIALDKELGLPPTASLDQLYNAMKGHVIAYGYTYGTYSR